MGPAKGLQQCDGGLLNELILAIAGTQVPEIQWSIGLALI